MDRALSYLPALYKKDDFIKAIFGSGQVQLDKLEADAVQLGNELLLSLMSEKQLRIEEMLCGIEPDRRESEQDRKAVVSSKWKAKPIVTLATLQAIADSWEDGKVIAAYPNAEYVRLDFEKDVKQYLKMLEAIRETMPAHIPLFASVLYSGNDADISLGFMAQIADEVKIMGKPTKINHTALNIGFVAQIADFISA